MTNINKKKNHDNASSKKASKSNMTKKTRSVIFMGGIVLSIAAVVLIVYAVQGIIGSEKQTTESLSDIKDSISKQTSSVITTAQPEPEQESNSQEPLETADPAPTLETVFSAETQPAGEPFGYMIFDTILDDNESREVALIEGTTPEDLDKGAGHYIGFSYPGENGNSPVFGHRTTVFKDFDRLKIDDTIKIVTNYGTYVYQIIDMQVTDPMAPIMFKVYDEPMLTLITCYPFIYAGHAPDRYVVICKLIDSSEETIES